MIIGICGLIGSGKGTVADILVNNHGFTKLSFADSLKDAVSAVFGWERALLEGDTEESRMFREQVDAWWQERLGIIGLTPRMILQQWGTEVCRNNFHNDIWILSLEKKIREISLAHAENYTEARIVIPDTRFPNEIEMIQRLRGEVWCVKRGEDPEWLSKYRSHGTEPVDAHSSEWAWARSDFDHVIGNDGTIDELEQRVRSLL